MPYASSSKEFETLLRGRYELLEKVGQGSYGDVYRAHDLRHHREVAIKRVRMHTGGGIRCALEPLLLRSLRHPYLLGADAVLTSTNYCCTVMPLALDDVDHYLATHPAVSLAQRLQWCWQICQGLACLHTVGVVHADLKDANCLVMPDQRCLLADYTLACLLPEGAHLSHTTAYTFTHRPPEVFLQRRWGHSADVWALGCTLYQMIYHQTLFPYQAETVRVDDERPLVVKMLACYKQFAYDTQQPDAFLTSGLLGKRPGKWYPPAQGFKSTPEYDGINHLILQCLRLVPSERPTMAQVLAHPVWRGQPLHPFRTDHLPVSVPSPWEPAFSVLPPPAQPWVPLLVAWAQTWKTPPPEDPSPWVWAALCLLLKVMHLSLYCSLPSSVREVSSIERNVLEDAGWSIPWKKWSAAGSDAWLSSDDGSRPQSPLLPGSPGGRGPATPPQENVLGA